MKKLVSLFVGFMIIGLFAKVASAADYEVKEGDTLWDIANEKNTSVEALMDINGLHSSLIYPKQVLKIDEEDVEYYEVQKGDTLSEISEVQGDDVTVEKLKAWNNLPSDLIITGQQLIVNGEYFHKAEKPASNNSSSEAESESVVSAASTEVSKSKEKDEPEKQETTLEGKTLSVEATAYTAYCSGCSGITATGVNLKDNPNKKVIAVDPNIIPLGTRVYVEGYGYAVAADTGGAIKGNKIDVHVPTKDEAYSWGRRTVEVTIIE
ncbi:3D domain-containing protein [Oceanobacillus salinisoli]|uniref:3D domain-containing protein n=1 Tax=Oceanobacillus salinisoli TaxID=2678611 RepID=UPI0012E0FBE3|nr:3D domain-containing protein [Oceanobacillus salinisoli]